MKWTASRTSWNRLLTPILTTCSLILALGPAGATTLELEGTADLLEKSDSVITGTVLEVQARMHPEHQFIYTYVTLQVEEVLKSSTVSPNGTIVLEELGGRVDNWIHQVPAVPEYEVGERVLSFLEDRPDGHYRTFGMIQGKFRFEIDARNGEQILTRPGEWDDVYFAVGNTPRELTAIRADGSYSAAKLTAAIREWIALN